MDKKKREWAGVNLLLKPEERTAIHAILYEEDTSLQKFLRQAVQRKIKQAQGSRAAKHSPLQ